MLQRLVTATCDAPGCDRTTSLEAGSIIEAIIKLRYQAANGESSWIIPAGRPTGDQRCYCSYEHYVFTEPTVNSVNEQIDPLP
jgi:hypothetical protein